jgi:ketosteroid isomerase-like protein
VKSAWRTALFLIGGLLACASAFSADPGRSALEAAIHRWTSAVNARDVATLETSMTMDVELSDGASTATGRDAALRALGELATRGQLVATTREITIANDIGWHVVALTQTRKNGDVQARGQALEIWKRVDREWKLHRRMMASVAGPGVLLERPSTHEPVLDNSAK